MRLCIITLMMVLFIPLGWANFPEKSQTYIVDQGEPGARLPLRTRFEKFRLLPHEIQEVVKGVLQRRIPKYFGQRLIFVDGYRINIKKSIAQLNKAFRPYRMQSTGSWVYPEYELHFILSDSTVGIRRYNVRLDLDRYGQVLALNLPQRNDIYTTIDHPTSTNEWDKLVPYELFPLKKAVETSITVADSLKIAYDSIQVDLIYNRRDDALEWRVNLVGKRKDAHYCEYGFIYDACSLEMKKKPIRR